MATSSIAGVSGPLAACGMPPPDWLQKSIQKIPVASAPHATVPDMLGSHRACQPIDPSTREQILLEHMPVVRFVARRIHERLPKHVELEDLVSAGIVGLIDALNKFDAKKNVQFRSYAQFRVRGAILDSLRVLDWGSRDLRRKGREAEGALQKLASRLGRRPSESEVARELHISLPDYQELRNHLKGLEIGSLQEMHSTDSAEEELAHVPADPRENPLLRCMKQQMTERLAEVVASLPEREAQVLSLYYAEEMTMKEIGAALGVGESRVSQMHASALLVLRARLTLREKYGRKSTKLLPTPRGLAAPHLASETWDVTRKVGKSFAH